MGRTLNISKGNIFNKTPPNFQNICQYPIVAVDSICREVYWSFTNTPLHFRILKSFLENTSCSFAEGYSGHFLRLRDILVITKKVGHARNYYAQLCVCVDLWCELIS